MSRQTFEAQNSNVCFHTLLAYAKIGFALISQDRHTSYKVQFVSPLVLEMSVTVRHHIMHCHCQINNVRK